MRNFLLLALLVTPMLSLPEARADDVYTFVIRKQDDKRDNRWSLADWLNTRDRMRVQDIWLAMHSPSPFEFYIGGTYQLDQQSPGTTFNGYSAYFAAYASIFGLEVLREVNTAPMWTGIFDFRILGFHNQATNLTLHLGLRETDLGAGYRNPLLGTELTFYFFKPFGIRGLYHYYFSSTPTTSGSSFTASRIEGGAFLDFSFFRVTADYFWEPDTETNGSFSQTIAASGVLLGGRLYF